MHRDRKTRRKLEIHRETLRSLTERELDPVAGAKPTDKCDPSIHTRCASCLCPI